MSFRRSVASDRGRHSCRGVGRLKVRAERSGHILGELRAPLEHVRSAVLGVAGVGRLTFCQVFDRLVHGPRGMGTKVTGRFERGIHGTIAERSNPIAQVAQRLPQSDGLVPNRLLRLDMPAEDRLQAFPDVPFATDKVLRRREVPRVQDQLGIGGRGRVGPGGLLTRVRAGKDGLRVPRGPRRPERAGGDQVGGCRPSPAGAVVVVDLGRALDQFGGARGLAPRPRPCDPEADESARRRWRC